MAIRSSHFLARFGGAGLATGPTFALLTSRTASRNKIALDYKSRYKTITLRIRFQTFCLMMCGSRTTWLLVAAIAFATVGCQPLQVNSLSDKVSASNNRDWSPQFATLPYAVGNPDGTIELFNIRNNLYVSENDFIPRLYNRTIQLSDIRAVDFVVSPFRDNESMAHTMLSFQFSDDTFLGVSAEIRTEKGETYSPVKGLGREYEITYVVADERDIIRLRTRYRNADVYIYRTVATPEQAQALFVDMMERVNQLARQPEFYHTIANNCTTNILDHINHIKPGRLLYNWKILLPGYSAEYAYDEGLLDQSVSFAQLTNESWINDLAERHFDDADFSRKIRQRLR